MMETCRYFRHLWLKKLECRCVSPCAYCERLGGAWNSEISKSASPSSAVGQERKRAQLMNIILQEESGHDIY